MKKSTGYATIYLLTIVLFTLVFVLTSKVKDNTLNENRVKLESIIEVLEQVIHANDITILSMHSQMIELEIQRDVALETPVVYDTIALGIPIARPKEYELHQEGVWSTSWEGGDLTHFRFIHLIHGELFVGCNECREDSKWTLTPFNKYYVSEIEQQEALLEIIRTRTFEYDGPTLDSSYVIVNEPK